MSKKGIWGIVLIIIGVILFVFGSYISGEVSDGEKKIKHAQQTVDQGKRLTSSNRYTKGIGNMAAHPVQKKIDEGKTEAKNYQTLASILHGSGIVVFIIGVGCIVFSFTSKHRKRK